MKQIASLLAILVFISQASIRAQQKWTETTQGNIATVSNAGGQTLGYSTTSGVKIISADGFSFKDFNKNSKLDKFEDWRLAVDVRAKDLASQLSIEQIAGLMLYSRHQPIPTGARGPFAGTYNGKPFDSSGARASDLSDQQNNF